MPRKSGIVKIYNAETGRGYVVEKAEGKLGESFEVRARALPKTRLRLRVGEEVSFEVDEDAGSVTSVDLA